jgi:hypothetical protein
MGICSRVGGRIENAKIPYAARHKLLLPKRHVATAIVQDLHEGLFHSGVKHVVSRLRRTYWIPAIRQVVGSVVFRCLKYLVSKATFTTKCSIDVLITRVSSVSLSASVLTNCAGFLGTHDNKARREQRLGCLFTCLTVRAVHLELVESLQTDSFILALRRFIASRGSPTDMHCDNGTNFSLWARKEN